MTNESLTTTDAVFKPRRMSTTRWIRTRGGRHAFAILSAIFALYPVIWIVSAAFNASNSLRSSSIIPSEITFDNFRGLFNSSVTDVGRWLRNSVVIGLIAATVNVIIAAFAAYAFSRFDFRGRRMVLTSLLVMQIFPQFLGFIAFFVLAQDFGNAAPSYGIGFLDDRALDIWHHVGFNTHGFLILVYIGGAAGFNAYLLKGFLDSIPRSLDEAARIDGAGRFTIFWRIIMPLARPMLAVIFMISFIAIFNEFILASFLLQGDDQLTLPVGLQAFLQEGYNAKWGLLAAVSLISAAPIVIVFIVAQKHIIGGLTSGGVKG